MDRRVLRWALSGWLAAACAGWLPASLAQDAVAPDTPAFRAAQARQRDAETLRALLAEGELLYQRDRVKLAGLEYCSQAVALAERGDFRASIRAAAKALHLGTVQSDDELVASAKRDFAIAYSYAGELDRAEQYASEALQQPGGALPTIAGPARKVLADALARRGRPREAIAAYEAALAASSERYRPLVEISLANAYVAAGEIGRARELYARIPPPPEPGARQFHRRGLANLELADGQPREALALFEQAAGETAGLDATYHRLWALDGVGRARLALGDRAGARRAFDEAARTAEQVRARFRSEEFKTGLFGDVQQVFERALALAAEDGDAAGAWALSEASRARALLDVVRGRVELRRAGADEPLGVDPLPLAQVQRVLRPGEAIVQFHSLEDRLVAWVLRPEGIEIRTTALARAGLEAAVEGLRQAVFKRSRAAGDHASALHAQLIEPLALRAGERLVVIPHGALHYLPFQALRGREGYLIERHAMAIAPSSSVATQLALRRREAAGRLVAFGNPDLGEQQYALPGSEREVREIAQLFPEPSVFLQRDATKRQFRQTAGLARVLHVAAHAQVDEVDPLLSRILLAGEQPGSGSPEAGSPGSGSLEAGSFGSGSLEAREVYDIDLAGVSLVTLSACESGLGRIARGDEILGFTRAFLTAGASGLVVSLWPVSDASTELLMTTFYGELARGAEAIDAMRAAQLAVLARPRFAHPFFWAPFDLIGDWRLRTRT